jgi:cardiolipin synthase A/B
MLAAVTAHPEDTMSRLGIRGHLACLVVLLLVATGCGVESPRDGALPPGLCASCAGDADCGGAGNRCLELGSGPACGVDCSSAACPADFLCADVTGGGRNCVPLTMQCPPPARPDPALDGGDPAAPEPDGGGLPACEATSPRSVPTVVYALPDAGEQPFLEPLGRAQSSIRVMVYLMGYGGILDALEAKARAGVSVQVILDQGQTDTNQKYFDLLTAAGATVRWSDPQFPYMHAKTIIVDGAEALISTGNFSKSYSIDLERNFVAHVADPDDVATLVALFDADWDRFTPALDCTRLLVSPVNARERLLALIDSATVTLTIESMQFADAEVRSHVAARQAAGVTVRAILADTAWIEANVAGAAYLAERGIEARSIPHCHVKALVADGARAYLGSENLSQTSLSRNREVGLVVTEPDAVRVVGDTFERDWAGGTAL